METSPFPAATHPSLALYSLEKLIEWKPDSIDALAKNAELALYSLEKLIEWKPISYYCSG